MDVIEIKKSHVIGVSILALSFIASLVFAYFMLTSKPEPASCWEQWQDYGEEVAIEKCEK